MRLDYYIKLKALGTYQIVNSITAIETAIVLEKQGFILEDYIEIGLYNTIWQGRLEIIEKRLVRRQ